MGAERLAHLPHRHAVHGQLDCLPHELLERGSCHSHRYPRPHEVPSDRDRTASLVDFKNQNSRTTSTSALWASRWVPATTCVDPASSFWTSGVGKTFPVYKDRVNLKFRVDAFNAFNHPNFQAPSFQTTWC